ncbi:hypothetical protein [Tenacibaculum sp.]|uniref:hypothetical protein n=1 Tax=Tenacibaculum sp. TaxID=1906242 RepID=UPI003D12A0D2
MKNSIIFLFVLLLLTPQIQAHNDVVVYDTIENHADFNELHEELHHQNDNDQQRSEEHHHHCSVISTYASFIPEECNYDFPLFVEIKQEITCYKTGYYNSYLSAIFQPPRV